MGASNESEPDSRAPRERILTRICEFNALFYIGLALVVTFASLNTLSFALGTLDESTSVVVLLNYVLLGVTFTGLLALILVCRSRR
jgi:hypothetical protein